MLRKWPERKSKIPSFTLPSTCISFYVMNTKSCNLYTYILLSNSNNKHSTVKLRLKLRIYFLPLGVGCEGNQRLTFDWLLSLVNRMPSASKQEDGLRPSKLSPTPTFCSTGCLWHQSSNHSILELEKNRSKSSNTGKL